MTGSPPLDILLPIYNAGPFLTAAVDSMARQTFTDFRCFLCDATTDGSSDFLADLAERDPRFVIIRQKKSSLSEALQEGLLETTAPLVARMDADDISLPNRFAVQMKIMEQRSDLLALGSAIRYMDAQGRPGRVAHMPGMDMLQTELLWGCPLSHPTVIFRRQAVLEAGGDRALFPYAEDYDLWLRLSRKGKLDNCDQVLLLYRMHGKNSVFCHALEGRQCTLTAQAAHMLALRTGKDPLENGSAASGEYLLNALPYKDRVLIQGRMLADSAHLIGDAEEDPQGGDWLEQVRALPRTAEVRRILASYHMRLVKRYAAIKPYKAIQHAILACKADTSVTLGFYKKLLMQHLPLKNC